MPARPKTRPPVTLTRHRLRYLLVVCDFTDTEIEDLTGWSGSRIARARTRWNLGARSEIAVTARHRLDNYLLCERYVLDETLPAVRARYQMKLREQFVAAGRPWEIIDAIGVAAGW